VGPEECRAVDGRCGWRHAEVGEEGVEAV
jgi:hypothetical protein